MLDVRAEIETPMAEQHGEVVVPVEAGEPRRNEDEAEKGLARILQRVGEPRACVIKDHIKSEEVR